MPKRVAILVPSLACGGTERVVINLLKGLVKHDVELELVLGRAEGEFLNDIPAGVKVVDLHTDAGFIIREKATLKTIYSLVRYLRSEKPDVIVSNWYSLNVLTAITRKLARSRAYLILVEHNPTFSRDYEPGRLLSGLMRWFYPRVDAVVAASKGLAQDFEANLRMKPGSIKVIYNPVVDESLVLKAHSPLDHPWFRPNQPPVILAVGRLHPQKNYPHLLQAFARLRKQRPARLLILGDGQEVRGQLEALVEQLKIGADVSLPGLATNPYAYMSRAAVFVLSSSWEGLAIVVVEAMYCGCQVVSADCQYGPREILAGGKYGTLVPVDDVSALFEAMQQALDSPKNPDDLKHRAEDFSIDKVVSEYMMLISR